MGFGCYTWRVFMGIAGCRTGAPLNELLIRQVCVLISLTDCYLVFVVRMKVATYIHRSISRRAVCLTCLGVNSCFVEGIRSFNCILHSYRTQARQSLTDIFPFASRVPLVAVPHPRAVLRTVGAHHIRSWGRATAGCVSRENETEAFVPTVGFPSHWRRMGLQASWYT